MKKILLIAMLVLVGIMFVGIVQSKNATVTINEEEYCETVKYEEKEPTYKDVIEERTVWDTCIGYAEENQSDYEYRCNERIVQETVKRKTGEKTVKKTKQECKPKSYTITVDAIKVSEYKLDFSDWGPCVYEEENGCTVVTCVSKLDGAHNGEFTDCRPGKSCQIYRGQQGV